MWHFYIKQTNYKQLCYCNSTLWKQRFLWFFRMRTWFKPFLRINEIWLGDFRTAFKIFTNFKTYCMSIFWDSEDKIIRGVFQQDVGFAETIPRWRNFADFTARFLYLKCESTQNQVYYKKTKKIDLQTVPNAPMSRSLWSTFIRWVLSCFLWFSKNINFNGATVWKIKN